MLRMALRPGIFYSAEQTAEIWNRWQGGSQCVRSEIVRSTFFVKMLRDTHSDQQMDRVLAAEAKGRGFDSRRARQYL